MPILDEHCKGLPLIEMRLQIEKPGKRDKKEKGNIWMTKITENSDVCMGNNQGLQDTDNRTKIFNCPTSFCKRRNRRQYKHQTVYDLFALEIAQIQVIVKNTVRQSIVHVYKKRTRIETAYA